MLDINLFRTDGEHTGDPDLIRESQRKRFALVQAVDEVRALDLAWREGQLKLEKIRKELNAASKRIGKLKAAKQDDEAKELAARTAETKLTLAVAEAEVREAKAALDAKYATIGNLVHESVVVSNDEANNAVLRLWGELRTEDFLKNHVDLCVMTVIVDLEKGALLAGGRGFFLVDVGVLLNMALVNYGLDFSRKRGYKLMQTPTFMTREAMAKCAQLAQFDEELYKIEGEDKFLIATAEQPLAAYHMGERIYPNELPIKYAGYSTCYRKKPARTAETRLASSECTSSRRLSSSVSHPRTIPGRCLRR